MSSPRNDALYQEQLASIGEPAPMATVNAPPVIDTVIAQEPVVLEQTPPERVTPEEDGLGLFRWIISDDRAAISMGCSLLDTPMSFFDEVSD